MASGENVAIVKSGAAALNYWVQDNRCLGNMLDLTGADLEGVTVIGGDFRSADLTGANCRNADFSRSYFSPEFVHSPLDKSVNPKVATIDGADFSGTDLSFTKFADATLKDVKLCRATILWADFTDAKFDGTDFELAQCGFTTFVNCDFAGARNLHLARHGNRSSIGVDTLQKSLGQIPDRFLQGCGLSGWEVKCAKLYNPNIKGTDVENILYEVSDHRIDGPLFLSSTFISYSWSDAKVVDNLYERLREVGIPVYLDRRNMVAGDIERQVFNAIRLNDVVLLVLSKDSIESDWVEAELEAARKKEREEQRDVLCPVAVDDSWKKKVEENVLWRQLKKKLVLDFSPSNSEAFDAEFQKLVRGIKLNYLSPKQNEPTISKGT